MFWSLYALVYDRIWSGPVVDLLADRVAELASGAQRIADLGCGTGLISARLRKQGAYVMGIDRSAAMLRRAVSNQRIDCAIRADIIDVDGADLQADTTLLNNVLHLHPDPRAVLAGAARMTKPGGLIIASWPTVGLSNAAIRRCDRHYGRGVVHTIIADGLRRWVSMLAALSRLGRAYPTAPALDLMEVVASVDGTALIEPIETLADAQQLAVFVVGGSIPGCLGARTVREKGSR